ncbi:hypothetical protein AVEN_10345-1 [Araneus ventricosus]|uniref:Uncharacterized protein n=1 Tax=Araneus ventricosus TaxID=182803 RepID=A0A4Y2UTL2_ARAVE|nr:hypothetical protein AVEN_10345-1 [Araneus ventricosus]
MDTEAVNVYAVIPKRRRSHQNYFTSEWIQKQSMSMQLYQRGGGSHQNYFTSEWIQSSQCLCSYTKEEEVTSEIILCIRMDTRTVNVYIQKREEVTSELFYIRMDLQKR